MHPQYSEYNKGSCKHAHNDQRFSHFHGAGLCAHTDDPCEEGYLRGAPFPVPLTFPDTRVLFLEEQDMMAFFMEGPKKNLSSEKKSEERRMADSDDIHPMEPREWGRHAWAFLHTSTFSYPEKPSAIQKESARQVFKNIGNILPCPVCRGHYNDNIKKNPPRVDSQESLSKWLVEIHNEVNKSRLQKTVDYETVRRHYLENSHELDCDCPRTYKLRKALEETKKTLSGMTVMTIVLLVLLVSVAGMHMIRKRR